MMPLSSGSSPKTTSVKECTKDGLRRLGPASLYFGFPEFAGACGVALRILVIRERCVSLP